MKILRKHLKKHIVAIGLIIIFLFIQEFCELSLPEYTSKIVDVGISQGGIKDNVFEVIRETEYNKILKIANSDDKGYIEAKYEKINKNTENKQKKYPILDSENIYTLKSITKQERKELSQKLENPIMILYYMNMQLENPNIANGYNKDMNLDSMDSKIKEQINKQYIKGEYEKIGVNIEKIQTNYIKNTGLKMLSLSFASMLTVICVSYLSSKVSSKLGRDLRETIVKKVMSFSNKEFKEIGASSLLTRSTNDISQVQMFIIMFLRIAIFAPIMGIGALLKVNGNSMNWIIGLAILTILIFMIIVFSFAMPKFKIIQKLIDRVNLVSKEILSGLPVIRSFSNEKHEEERFDVANKDLKKTSLFVDRIMCSMMPIMTLIMNLICILIVWVGADKMNMGTIQIGTLMAFIQYTMQIIMAFLMISMLSIMLPRAIVSLKRLNEVYVKDISVKDKKDTQEFNKKFDATVEFKDVYFRYHDAEEDILENISFKAVPGTTTAIIGSTGSGKTTLINLIPRFFDVTGGKILIDGKDIRNVKLHDLREKIGFVPQNGILFSGTIESNIALNENIDQKNIKEAAEIAQSSDFINEKPKKFKSEISQGGTNVSGGQKQRLSIARAIAKKPNIYVFDDSFSALDFKTDKKLRKELSKITKKSTVFIVAQRISTILKADQIIVLDEGKMVGIGTHKQLMKKCKVYQEIAYSQLSKEELANE